PKDQHICGLVRVGLWALWAGAEVYFRSTMRKDVIRS
ncbi:hypothetical protein ACN38_g8217, partial [Penicillium nordicum]